MGRYAQVLSFERTVEDGANVENVVCDPGGGANVTAEHFEDSGSDSQPLPGDIANLEDASGTGVECVTGYCDPKNAGKAGKGEKRIYARAADGTPVSELWLKSDGSAVITGLLAGWSFAMGVDGSVTINGVKITSSGAVTATGEITAMAASPATSVSLSTHLHGTGVGPTTAPTPGT